MKKEPRWKFFIREMNYWIGRVKLPQSVQCVRDNRINSCLCVDDWDKGQGILRYNVYRLGHVPECYFYSCLFHELGHLINKLPYGTDKEREQSEFKAEQYSCTMLKKHFPREYKRMLLRMTKMKSMLVMKKKEPLYYRAFIRIRDYKKTMEVN